MRVTVDGTRLYFDVEGAGVAPDGSRLRRRPTIVLVHGGPGGDHSQFKPTMSPLADVAQLVYLDLRGHGRSDESPPETWNLARWADDVRAFCDALEIERPIVLGASFGSFVALTYAARHPGHAVGLVLLEAAARFERGRILAAYERFGDARVRAVAERFLDDPTEANHLEYRRACKPLFSVRPTDPSASTPIVDRAEISRHFFRDEARTVDLRKAAASIRCPVLIVNGERDPVTPVDAAEELAQALAPDVADLVLLPGASHDLLWDTPDEVVALIGSWLERNRFLCAFGE